MAQCHFYHILLMKTFRPAKNQVSGGTNFSAWSRTGKRVQEGKELEAVTQSHTWTDGGRAPHRCLCVQNLPATQDTWVQSLSQEDLLEKGRATLSRILAWRIPRTEEPGGLQSMGLQRVRHNWTTNTFIFIDVKPIHTVYIFPMSSVGLGSECRIKRALACTGLIKFSPAMEAYHSST